MNIASLLQVGLYLPYALFLLIFLIVFLIRGYKRGLVRSACSLGATALSAGISLLIAKGLGWLLAGPILNALPEEVTAELASMGTLVQGLLQGLMEVVAALVLFGLCFPVLLIVCKSVTRIILDRKSDEEQEFSAGSRLGGMAIRLVDAALVTVLLLLPLYGTLATAIPPVTAALRISESMEAMETEESFYSDESQQADNAAVLDMMDAIADHPTLLPYRYGPGAWVYSALSSFSMNGNPVDLSAIAASMEGLSTRFQDWQTAAQSEDPQAVMDATQELIRYTRDEVVGERWSYNLLMGVVSEMEKEATEQLEGTEHGEEILNMYEQVKPLTHMSYEDYKDNAEQLLDFGSYYIDRMEKLQKGEEITEEDMLELQERTEELFNGSEQLSSLSSLILPMLLDDMSVEGAGLIVSMTDSDNDEEAVKLVPYTGGDESVVYFEP